MKKGMCSLVIALAFAIPSHAQQTTPITVGQVTCGKTGTPLFNCYAVPLTVGTNSGTAWFFPQYTGGFILFRPNLEGPNYVTAQVTSTTVNARNAIGQVTQATYTFTVVADPNTDGDSDTMQGMITIDFSYYYSTGGGGRGGGGAGWYMKIVGGSGQQSITQD